MDSTTDWILLLCQLSYVTQAPRRDLNPQPAD
jgi:hypothetical protein